MDFLESLFKKNEELFFNVIRNVFIITLILFLLDITNVLEVHKYFNLFLIQIQFAVIILIMIIIQQKRLDKKEYKLLKQIVKIAFLVSLFLVTISTLKYDWIAFFTKPLFSAVRILSIITIALGVLLFQQNKEQINNIGDEKEREEHKEKKRASEFSTKFPKIAKIPIFRNIIQGVYKEGWWFIIGLIIVFGIFLYMRFSMFKFIGNYPDEYSHILSGLNLFENGVLPKLVTYTESWQYTRGMHISFLVGVYMFLFGKTLAVAKLVPITLGTLNFFMLRKISKNILKSKFLQIIYLLVFSFMSWTIFNHFYIRGYVFTEFSIILMVFLSFMLTNHIKNNRLVKTSFIFVIMCAVTFINYHFSNDTTKFIIPIAFFFQMITIFFISIFRRENKLSSYISNMYKRKESKYILMGLAFLFMLLLILNKGFFESNIITLLHGATKTGFKHIDFNGFFFNLNFIFGFLSILSITILFFIKDKKTLLLYLTILPLLILHAISNKNLQIMRGMMYIYPLFFLSSFLVLDRLPKMKYKLINVVLILLIVLSFIPVLQENYHIIFEKNYPLMPSEIGYHEYSKQYDFMKNNLTEYTFFAVQYNIQKQEFFGFKYNYKLDFMNVTKNHYTHYIDDKGVIRQLFTNTLVITDFSSFKEFVENKKCCVVFKSFSKKYFLGKEKYDYIISNTKLVNEGIGYKIYCN